MSNSLTVIAAIANALTAKDITPTMPLDRGNWWHSIVREPFTGAWQRNMEIRNDSVLIHQAVYSCITLIASDIAKCRLRLVEMDSDGIWNETTASAFSPVLNEPNRYQNAIQFIEYWMISKLINGNTYILKVRDGRGVVSALYILDPIRTTVRVAPDGSVYYELRKDNLSGIQDENILVPASEIIHDMMTLKHHPLCGMAPLAPAALAAEHSLNIQRNSSKFFNGGSLPSGVLTAPAGISADTAKRAKETWAQAFGSGDNVGKIVALGDGLKFEPMAFSAINSQLIEQLELSSKMVCTSFNVPPHKVHVGDPPSYDNIEALNRQYYTDCIQKHMEGIELLLDKGLGLENVPGKIYGTEFDKDDLFSMDSATQFKAMADGVRGGFIAPNEARKKFNYSPVTGGDSPMMQHQDYSLEDLAKRSAQDDPFASKNPTALPAPPTERALSDFDISIMKQKFAWLVESGLEKKQAA